MDAGRIFFLLENSLFHRMPLSPDTHQAALPATQGALGWARTAASSARAAFCACAFRDAASPMAWCLFQKELLPAGQRRGPSHGAVVVAGSGLHPPNFSSHVAPSSAASTLPPSPVRSVCPLGFDLRRSAGAALKPVLSATPRSLCPSVSAESFQKPGVGSHLFVGVRTIEGLIRPAVLQRLLRSDPP